MSSHDLPGVKQVPIDHLLEDKTYIFFSHTIKAQPENMPLLDAMLQKVRCWEGEQGRQGREGRRGERRGRGGRGEDGGEERVRRRQGEGGGEGRTKTGGQLEQRSCDVLVLCPLLCRM